MLVSECKQRYLQAACVIIITLMLATKSSVMLQDKCNPMDVSSDRSSGVCHGLLKTCAFFKSKGFKDIKYDIVSNVKYTNTQYDIPGCHSTFCIQGHLQKNVGILKKQGGGYTLIPLPFFTVFNIGDPPKKGLKMQNKP